MKSQTSKILAAGILAALASTSALAAPKVVATIKPLHSLVAQVMGNVGEPTLIVDTAQSPHTFSLKPSNASAIQNADIVFWIGPDMELFMRKPLESLGASSKAFAMSEADGVTVLSARYPHDHDDEEEHADHDDHKEADHNGHDDHKEEHHDDHDEKHDDHKEEHHDHEEDHAGHDHGESGNDPHIWLDPQNAIAMVGDIAKNLSAIDAENAPTYEANAAAAIANIEKLSTDLSTELEAVKDQKFMVFHDAYQYFERRFGLETVGPVTLNPAASEGAKRLKEVQEQMAQMNVKCVFGEPQFDTKRIDVVIEGTDVKFGILDPIGNNIEAGPMLYNQLLTDLGNGFETCLK